MRTEAGKRLLRQIAVDHPTWPEQGLVEAIEAIEREVVDTHRCIAWVSVAFEAEIDRLRRIESAARAAVSAGWFTTNDEGDRAADALRAALEQQG